MLPEENAAIDPDRYAVHRFRTGPGHEIVFTREGIGGVPLVLVHGWPETRRIFWRVIDPLVAAGFEVIVPDLRGFGSSDVAADGRHDAVGCGQDLVELLASLGHDRVVLAGGDFGGPVIQHLAGAHPDLVDRLVIFNSPLPMDPARMPGLTMGTPGTVDYFLRQGTDPDGLAADLATADQRRRYIATFYTSRLWAHPGAFDDDAVAFHAEPFADPAKLRASFGPYESAFDRDKRSGRTQWAIGLPTRTLILFGPSDKVIGPDFDRIAEIVFPNRVGPFLLRDCGHFVPWEAADRFVGATVAFCGDLLAVRRSAGGRPDGRGDG